MRATLTRAFPVWTRPTYSSISFGLLPAAVMRAGERVRYSTPEPGGAEYVAICLPAFSPDLVHRDP